MWGARQGFDKPTRPPEGISCRELEHKLQNVLMFSWAAFCIAVPSSFMKFAYREKNSIPIGMANSDITGNGIKSKPVAMTFVCMAI